MVTKSHDGSISDSASLSQDDFMIILTTLNNDRQAEYKNCNQCALVVVVEIELCSWLVDQGIDVAHGGRSLCSFGAR
jgi:hypothetical protein